MTLPPELAVAIERVCGPHAGASLARAATLLSERYRRNDGSHAIGPAETLAYLAVRMPATYAAASSALAELGEALPSFRPVSLLDLGAGPGTASWAATQLFSSIQHTTLVERDRDFISFGRTLAEDSSMPLAAATWLHSDLERDVLPGERFDLVLLSFALNEIKAIRSSELIASAWSKTGGALLIVEPGTTAGFARIRAARDQLIHLGGNPAAPCPHAFSCPLQNGPDWCHAAVRLPRSRLHRGTKHATLGFEDEKFSYVAFARQAPEFAAPRVLFPPRVTKPRVEVLLCQPDGTADRRTIPARNHDAYKRARHWRWGQSLREPDDRTAIGLS